MRTNHLSGLALGAILAAGSPAWSQHLALVVKSTSPHSWAMKRMVLEDVLAPASVPTLQARRVRLPVADDQDKKESKESPKAGPSAVTNSSRAWAPGKPCNWLAMKNWSLNGPKARFRGRRNWSCSTT